ncbi:hypothetical protein [Actinomyces wuliandei]|nr:hypothetical protein [Actinomyces wuliandei]
MRKLVTWDVDARFGLSEMFTLPQTPETIADEITQSLTVPTYLAPGAYFSLGVRPLPEGMADPEDLPQDHPYQHTYEPGTAGAVPGARLGATARPVRCPCPSTATSKST